MSSIGSPITQTIPALGTVGPTYATNINAFLTEVKTRLEAKVPFASILGSGGPLDANNQKIQNVHSLGLYEIGSTPGASNEGTQVLASGAGDLYWINASGVTVKITAGSSLSFASAGLIGGDYATSSGPAALNYDDATNTYWFFDDITGGTVWANTKSLGHYFVSTADNSRAAYLQFSGAASLNMKLPATLPGANNAVMSQDSTGLMSTGTITANVVIGGAATVTTPNDIILTGTAKLETGTRKRMFVGTLYSGDGANTTFGLEMAANNGIVQMALPGFDVNARINTIDILHTQAAAVNQYFRFGYMNNGGWHTIDTITVAVIGTPLTNTITVTAPAKLVSTRAYGIQWESTGGTGSGDVIHYVGVNYDNPA